MSLPLKVFLATLMASGVAAGTVAAGMAAVAAAGRTCPAQSDTAGEVSIEKWAFPMDVTSEGQMTVLPHPTNCSRCIAVFKGQPFQLNCPPSLHFNPKTLVCEFPNSAGCLESRDHVWRAPDPERNSFCPPMGRGYRHLLLKNPRNCSQFFDCFNGNLIVRDCPPGLHFHTKLLFCVLPVRADCKNTEENLTRKNVNPIRHICPPPGSGDGNLLLFPNPRNCSQYFACDNGDIVLKDCPSGLHFNSHSLVCDFPSTAGCQEIETIMVFPKSVSHKRDTPLCPPPGNPDEKLHLFPYPGNCSQYLACDNGELVVRDCPPKLHFNPNSMVCEFSWSAGCVKAVTPGIRQPLFPSPPPQNALACRTDSEEGELILLPHAESCSKYFLCVEGQLVQRDCPGALHFSPKRLVCEFPWRAGCEKRLSTEPTCRPSGEGNLQIFPDPEDCSRYRVCDNGVLVTMSCPDGLHFNAEKKVCDFPENVKCQKINPDWLHFLWTLMNFLNEETS